MGIGGNGFGRVKRGDVGQECQAVSGNKKAVESNWGSAKCPEYPRCKCLLKEGKRNGNLEGGRWEYSKPLTRGTLDPLSRAAENDDTASDDVLCQWPACRSMVNSSVHGYIKIIERQRPSIYFMPDWGIYLSRSSTPGERALTYDSITVADTLYFIPRRSWVIRGEASYVTMQLLPGSPICIVVFNVNIFEPPCSILENF
ncbi:hypothetical protein F5Y04DRAFT_246663 [Hypomontagnella monticulosa]|nr:hypothetical protein F5Y04DRAFT_246663 [Hypomontagnella monticulosa]